MRTSSASKFARRDLFSSMFSLAIIASALFVTQHFILPLLWAVILCVATWPLYLRMLRACSGHTLAAAAVTTLISALVFVTPLVLGAIQAAHQAPALAAMVAEANNAGIGAPQWLLRIPAGGASIFDWWAATLGQPHGLAHLMQDGSLARLHSASDVLRTVGANLLHRMIDIGFTFMALFFFYKDGLALRNQVGAIGDHLIGTERWDLYSTKIPTAIRATVNGLVLVGLAEGVLLGIAYEFAGVPSAVLWAAATGVLAIIPFGAPLAFGAVALLLLIKGSTAAAIAIIVFGTAVLMVADHLVRPTIIGNATALPFLAVLLGILGGVEMFGLIGLFVGPVVMTLFVTLWHEENLFSRERE
jgi:predicted PurR-regulated permease PerM